MFIHSIDENTTLALVEMRDADELFELVDASRMYLREWLPWVEFSSPNCRSGIAAPRPTWDDVGSGFGEHFRRHPAAGTRAYNRDAPVHWDFTQEKLKT